MAFDILKGKPEAKDKVIGSNLNIMHRASIAQKLSQLLKQPEPYNTASEGTYQDEMRNSYIQLMRLDIPKDARTLIEPEAPTISVKLTVSRAIVGERFNDFNTFILRMQTFDFKTLETPRQAQNETYHLDTKIDQMSAVNLYGFGPVQTCFFLCTRDGRIFINDNYLNNSPKLVSEENITSALKRIKKAFDSRFSVTDKRKDLLDLQRTINS